MLECIFTIDYEIYGNGEGSLRDLVLEPMRRLADLLARYHAPCVVFVEAAELEMLEQAQTDPAIGPVRQQILDLRRCGHEIALHLHPQWYNAQHLHGRWQLDYREYNLCTQPLERITEIVQRSLRYLRHVLDEPAFVPVSFRAGNWLFQPTARAASALADHGIKIDSSVFKRGLQRIHGLDYRPAARNGFFWRFQDDVNVPHPAGRLLEIPILTRQVPFWQMATSKRLGLQQKGSAGVRTTGQRFQRLLDRARFWHPLKFDFCRMTLRELTTMIDWALQRDRATPDLFKPLVAIGHTKDLEDLDTIDAFVAFLAERRIPVSTLEAAYPKCHL
jgi:hypothetical protein